jgi:predicted O-methyltransferase YrrM
VGAVRADQSCQGTVQWRETDGALLEPRLAPGALVVADDITLPSMASYLDYVRDPANEYVNVSFPVEDGMEISCRAGARTTTTGQ